MAPTSTPSFASERVSESSYASLNAHETSSHQHPSGHDKYNPSLDNTKSLPKTPPLISAGASSALASEVHSSHQSLHAISSEAKEALAKLYESVTLCLVTRMDCPVVCHIVPCATTSQRLSLYEYCLGCDWLTFHVHSRRNLVFLDPNLNAAFDKHKWLLLPDLSTLREVKSFVESVLAARRNSSEIESFTSKWNLNLKTAYTFMPLPTISRQELYRHGSVDESSKIFPFPFKLPPLECHVSPPLAVINGGAKLAHLRDDLDDIALTYHEETTRSKTAMTQTSIETKEHLTLLRGIYDLIMGAQEDAKKWEESHRTKRKRDDFDDIGRDSQRSGSTTRSSVKTRRNTEPSSHAGTQPKDSGGRKRDKKKSGSRKRDTKLTGDVLARLGKHHERTQRIKEWAEATARHWVE